MKSKKGVDKMSCVAENIGRKINTFLKLVLVLSLLVVLCPLKAEAANILGTGVDGELVVNPGQTVFIDQWYNNKYGSEQYMATAENIPNFSKVTIMPNGTLTVSAWNGSTGGRLFFKCTGDVLVQGTISVNGKGYRARESVSSGQNSPSYSTGYPSGGGGGGSGSGGAGNPGTQGVYSDNFTTLAGSAGVAPSFPDMGGGGGNAADSHPDQGETAVGGKGGNGGGHVKIYADSILVTGQISANGNAGTNGSFVQGGWVSGVSGGGGGGAGGAIELCADTINIGQYLVTAKGGKGGTGYFVSPTYRAGHGGQGGSGRIYINYGTTRSGTSSTPIIYTHIDLTPPTGTMQINNGAYNTASRTVNLKFNATDNVGITTAVISNDNFITSQTIPYSNSISWDLVPGEGPKQVWVKLLDEAGNETVLTNSINFVSDLQAPAVQVEINGGARTTTSANLEVVINASDNLSLITEMQMRHSFNGLSWTAWEPFKFNKSITLNPSAVQSSPEIRRLFVQVKDKAGNIGNGYSSIIFEKAVSSRAAALEQASVNDFTPPEISISTADGRTATRSGSKVPIILQAKDNVTPLEDLEVSMDKGATWQAYEPFFNIGVSGSGMKTIYVLVRDQEGNISSDYIQLFVL
jgi:hypothetical protein